MTDTKQPEALQIAATLETLDMDGAADAVRRIHAENADLQRQRDAAQEVAAMNARSGASYAARVQELEAQLAAIGAGGVEPLRRRECLHQIAEPAVQSPGTAQAVTPVGEPSNVELRGMWYGAGGSFHGPNVETGMMPEANLLPFLRSLLASRTEAQPAPAAVAGPVVAGEYPPLPESITYGQLDHNSGAYGYRPQDMRAYVDADRAMRASSAQAPSGVTLYPGCSFWGMKDTVQPVPAVQATPAAVVDMDSIYAVYEKCLGKQAPDAEMAQIVDKTRLMLFAWWGEHREAIRAALVAAPVTQPAPVAQEDALEAKLSASTSITENTLLWWRELASLNPQELIPRIDSVLREAARSQAKEGGA